MDIMVILLLASVALLLVAYRPRGATTGRTSFIPGQYFAVSRTGRFPLIGILPTTRMEWRGRAFEFVLVQLPNGTCRAYIARMPPYSGLPEALSATHRLTDAFGRPYVCWAPEPRSPDALAAVLALWIVATSRYLDTGTFPDGNSARQELLGAQP